MLYELRTRFSIPSADGGNMGRADRMLEWLNASLATSATMGADVAPPRWLGNRYTEALVTFELATYYRTAFAAKADQLRILEPGRVVRRRSAKDSIHSARYCACTATLSWRTSPTRPRRRLTPLTRRRSGETDLVGPGHSLTAAGHRELGDDVRHVHAGRLLAHEESRADATVGVALDEQAQHLHLFRSQVKRPWLRRLPLFRQLVAGPQPQGDRGDADGLSQRTYPSCHGDVVRLDPAAPWPHFVGVVSAAPSPVATASSPGGTAP